VQPGNSVHLDLGGIILGTALPPGNYTTDVGVYSACVATFCLVSTGVPPDFADAGVLTITVTDVSEPATTFLLGSGLIGLLAGNRSKTRTPNENGLRRAQEAVPLSRPLTAPRALRAS
jgi:hypothetical protein